MSRWSSPVLVPLGGTRSANGPYREVYWLSKEGSRYHYGLNAGAPYSCIVNGPPS